MTRKIKSRHRSVWAFSLSVAALSASGLLAVSQPSQAQSLSCVSADSRANASGGFTIPGNCTQYFGNGATFPGLFYRRFADYFGIAIPANTGGQTGAVGTQPTTPTGSPRANTVQYNYCLTGSGNGRAVFVGTASASATCSYTASFSGGIVTPGNGTAAPAVFPTTSTANPPLFAGSDVPLSSSGLSSYAANRQGSRGLPIQVPTVFGAVALAYNNNLTSTLSLSTSDLCGIFDGSLTDWSQIQGTGGLSGPINVIIRSDSSGTTNIFTSYLAAACGSGYYLSGGVNTFPTGLPQTARFVRVAGNDGIVNTVASTSFAVGYAEASFTAPFSTNTPSGQPAPRSALVQNPASGGGFVAPVVSTIRSSLGSVALQATNSSYPCVLQVNPSSLPVLPTNPAAYPIVGATYALLYSRYPSADQADAARGLFLNILGNAPFGRLGANDQVAQGLGFVVLTTGSTIQQRNDLRAQARACVSAITSL